MLTSCIANSSLRGVAVQTRTPQQKRTSIPLVTPARAAQSLQGKVVSIAPQKTAVVQVDTLVVHPVYQKRVRSSTKYIAHDEQEECSVGDVVTLTPSRPLSKRKRFVVGTIVRKAK